MSLLDLLKQREELDRQIEEERKRIYPHEALKELEDMQRRIGELEDEMTQLKRYRRPYAPYPEPWYPWGQRKVIWRKML